MSKAVANCPAHTASTSASASSASWRTCVTANGVLCRRGGVGVHAYMHSDFWLNQPQSCMQFLYGAANAAHATQDKNSVRPS